jgi:hypothetical protein
MRIRRCYSHLFLVQYIFWLRNKFSIQQSLVEERDAGVYHALECPSPWGSGAHDRRQLNMERSEVG